MWWRARQRRRQRDEAVKKRETVRPRKDRAAAPAYQLFQESSAGISINSNDKCGPLWHRLINSVCVWGGGGAPEQEFKSFNATGLNKCSEGACWALLCFGITTVPLHVMEQLEPFYITVKSRRLLSIQIVAPFWFVIFVQVVGDAVRVWQACWLGMIGCVLCIFKYTQEPTCRTSGLIRGNNGLEEIGEAQERERISAPPCVERTQVYFGCSLQGLS